jgi:hypothetical protein
VMIGPSPALTLIVAGRLRHSAWASTAPGDDSADLMPENRFRLQQLPQSVRGGEPNRSVDARAVWTPTRPCWRWPRPSGSNLRLRLAAHMVRRATIEPQAIATSKLQRRREIAERRFIVRFQGRVALGQASQDGEIEALGDEAQDRGGVVKGMIDRAHLRIG